MSEEWVTVVTASGRMEAEILRGLLEAAGLQTWLTHESAASAVGLGVGPLARVDVRVPAEEEEAARQALEDYYSGRLENP